MKAIVIDTETSGINPKHNRLMSVGMVAIEIDKQEIFGEFEVQIWADPSRCDASALAFNGINLSEHNNHPDTVSSLEAVQRMIAFIKSAFPEKDLPVMLIGHNVDFDISFIKELFDLNRQKTKYEDLFHYRKLDTQSILRFFQLVDVFPKDSKKLGDWLDYFEIENDKHQLHNALYDAQVTTKLLFRLLDFGCGLVNTELNT